jgi:hypothetical protein
VAAKPAVAPSNKAAEADTRKSPEPATANALSGLGIPLVIVSRYEPLSGRDSLEAVPDLNRGRGKGK